MGMCDVCGNDSDLGFSITMPGGGVHRFDSFECAIQLCAPRCAKCACAVIGHGLDADGVVYCSARCMRAARVVVASMTGPADPGCPDMIAAGAADGDLPASVTGLSLTDPLPKQRRRGRAYPVARSVAEQR
ncbi:hypothetical protein [Phytoactinopolyspora alkaliphila]|uniref:hypothetical protein n=1 Tax=Phytoactinopolyspora alkaliphila TaxID=1783498 RepID=UPI001C2063A1|nr:hypothetical protein [Phytoactinopolyspora alkaliphila]